MEQGGVLSNALLLYFKQLHIWQQNTYTYTNCIKSFMRLCTKYFCFCDVCVYCCRHIVQVEETLKIRVKPGWKKGTKITFEDKGDEKPGSLPADIIFFVDEKRHPIFKREGDDLQLGVEVPLIEALTGCTITVPLLGGEEMTLSFDEILYPGYVKVIPGQGMPKPKQEGKKGDLRLNFLVEFPRELSDDQRSNVKNILNECS